MAGSSRAAVAARAAAIVLLLALLPSCAWLRRPSGPAVDGGLQPEARIERLLADGQPSVALAEAERQLRTDPASLPVRRAHQDCLIALGRVDEALAIADAAVREQGDPDSRVLLARLVDDRSARAELTEALRFDPRHPWALYGRAVLSVRAGDVDDALGFVDRSLEADPALTEARRLRAELRDRVGRFDGAADDYRTYLEARPGDIEAMYNLAAILHQELDESADASRLYEELLRIDPTHTKAVVGLAVCATEREEFARAEQLYLTIADRESVALFNLGLLYADDLDRPEDARDCFVRYLEHAGAEGADRVVYAPLYIQELERRLAEPEAER